MCRTTLLACEFGYGDASFQLAIEYALLQQGHPVEAESVGALNSHFHKLPNKFLAFACWRSLWRRRKYDNLVCAGSPHQTRAVCFAGAFAKHFHLVSNQPFENPANRFVYYLEQILIALFFDVFVDLIRDFRRRSIPTRRITKHERVIELDFLDQIACLPVVVVRLAGKPDDDVSGDRNAIACPPDALDQIEILLRGVRAVHRFQDLVRAGLQRQMNVLGKFWQSGDCVDQVVAETDRMRRSETKSLKPFDLVNGFEQLHERGFVVDLRKFMATVKINDLPQ